MRLFIVFLHLYKYERATYTRRKRSGRTHPDRRKLGQAKRPEHHEGEKGDAEAKKFAALDVDLDLSQERVHLLLG